MEGEMNPEEFLNRLKREVIGCLLYTSDAADE